MKQLTAYLSSTKEPYMFENLSQRLSQVFQKLQRKGLLTVEDIDSALKEIRMALLEADVALPVVKEVMNLVKEKATGQEVLQSITPSQMVIKIVHDTLIQLLSSDDTALLIAAPAPAIYMLVGLQGSGKTTSCAKIGHILTTQYRKKVLMVSVDIYRPAAQKQLEILGKNHHIATLPIVPEEKPLSIIKRALKTARQESYDSILIDTAGRLHTDQELMTELQEIQKETAPIETLLVADAMTGHDALKIAQAFKEAISLTGIILTRSEGDGRGGAALSMRFVTQCPIKFLGTGEKIDQIEVFEARRIADRILDKGDIVGFVEKISEHFNQEEQNKLMNQLQSGQFTLNDMLQQLLQFNKLGGINSFLKFIPGLSGLKDKLGEMGQQEKKIAHQIAIIRSMTPLERINYKILNARRKQRISQGSGRPVSEINRLLKQFQEMETMMKKMRKTPDLKNTFAQFLRNR